MEILDYIRFLKMLRLEEYKILLQIKLAKDRPQTYETIKEIENLEYKRNSLENEQNDIIHSIKTDAERVGKAIAESKAITKESLLIKKYENIISDLESKNNIKFSIFSNPNKEKRSVIFKRIIILSFISATIFFSINYLSEVFQKEPSIEWQIAISIWILFSCIILIIPLLLCFNNIIAFIDGSNKKDN